MRKGLATTAVLAVLVLAQSVPATAVPAPPPQGLTDSHAAIDALEPFIGTWRSEKVLASGERQEIFRRVARGPGDVVYIALGEKRDGIEYINVIVYDTESRQLRLFLPGYRTLGPYGDSAEFAPMIMPDENSLQWVSRDSLSYDDVIRTTVRIEGRVWRETIETLHPSGGVEQTIMEEFHRMGDARISF